MRILRTLSFTVLPFFLLCACHPVLVQQKKEAQQYVIQGDPDSSTVQYLLPYKQHLDSLLGATLIISAQPLEKKNPEGLLGDLVADACLTQGKKLAHMNDATVPVAAVLNNGGLRISLPKGAITRRHIYELMPFENSLVEVIADSALVMQWMNDIAQHGGAPVSGVKMVIRNKAAEDVRIDDKPLRGGDIFYPILTSDYLANGGDNLTFLKTAKQKPTGIKVRDAILYQLEVLGKSQDTLTLQKDGRIQSVE